MKQMQQRGVGGDVAVRVQMRELDRRGDWVGRKKLWRVLQRMHFGVVAILVGVSGFLLLLFSLGFRSTMSMLLRCCVREQRGSVEEVD